MRDLKKKNEPGRLDLQEIYETAMPLSPDTVMMVSAVLARIVHPQAMGLTRLMDTLYLLQERFALEKAFPLVILPFSVWKCGPVQRDLYADLVGDMSLLGGALRRQWTADGPVYHAAVDPESLTAGHLAHTHLRAIDDQVRDLGRLSDAEVHALAVRPESCWARAAEAHGLAEAMRRNVVVTSRLAIDFSRWIEDPQRAAFYEENLDNLEMWAAYGA